MTHLHQLRIWPKKRSSWCFLCSCEILQHTLLTANYVTSLDTTQAGGMWLCPIPATCLDAFCSILRCLLQPFRYLGVLLQQLLPGIENLQPNVAGFPISLSNPKSRPHRARLFHISTVRAVPPVANCDTDTSHGRCRNQRSTECFQLGGILKII